MSLLPSFPPSDLESALYYRGLPSNPRLVARTGAPWSLPTGPWQIPKRKELRPVGNHPLKEVWEDDLALKIHTLLDSLDVRWTSIDVVRIAVPEDSGSFAFVVLWIGVMPETLSGDEGVVVVSKCREILLEYDIAEVEVEIRESVVTRSVGPALLEPVDSGDLTAGIREPLTPTLGLSISPASKLEVEGTGGFFVTDERDPSSLLLVTCRHAVLPPQSSARNIHYAWTDSSQPKKEVVLLGEGAFDKFQTSVREAVVSHQKSVVHTKREVEKATDTSQAKTLQILADAAQLCVELTSAFQQSVATWTDPSNRILGDVVLAPPIALGAGLRNYTEDWALIELGRSKINETNLAGNFIDLGMEDSDKFARKMCPRPPHEFSSREPSPRPSSDAIVVLKRGAASDLTLGRANTLVSYVREYTATNEIRGTSKEWAILPYSEGSRAFSRPGDSGAVIVDGSGRIGGLLTGGTGRTPKEASDIAYATPIDFIMERMRENGVRPVIVQPTET
ncbi:hypothetical protein B0H16DRAFT_1661939 [Mycena metata]|uniref:Uncharacterized protein n=1 Tax=Mycena metata TaxID=1033252 RepID=A0AAD7JCD5_9AGAR|nr:hypothetical protein B0H16DRAFT_1661939 [Mycena metata]